MASRPCSFQWHTPTLVLRTKTASAEGVVGLMMRGEELSTGKKRPFSPPSAPPGHVAQPPEERSMPVVVTAMW